MEIIRDLEAWPVRLCHGAVAIGNFDGVHRGHARIVEKLTAAARAVAGPAIVFTFDPHPVRLLRPDAAPPPLTWTDRKAALLADLGVNVLVAYPTDEALLRLQPQEFFNQIVLGKLKALAMVEGPNFRFGHTRVGTIELLRTLTVSNDINLEVVEPLIIGGEVVSSSRVRRLIAAGAIEEAYELLTQPYRIRGMVVHGVGRGHKIGFPTANVDAVDTLLPAVGVYAGRVPMDGEYWPAAINIGTNPTFGEQTLKVEVHVIGWSDSLYGLPLEVDFLSRLRDIQNFKNVDALKQQLQADVAAAMRAAKDAQ